MSKLRKNQYGFTGIETLLTLTVVVLLVVVGAMVYNNQQKTRPLTTQTSSSGKKTTADSNTKLDSTANWTVYASPDGKLSLKYPKTWATAAKPELCSAGVLLLGSDSTQVGKCGSSDFGQISITWQPTSAACTDLSSDTTTVENTQKITVSGASGLKQTTTFKGGSEQQFDRPPSGTKSVNYCFAKGGYTYIADYKQLSTAPEVLNDFNLMVTKTLKFN